MKINRKKREEIVRERRGKGERQREKKGKN